MQLALDNLQSPAVAALLQEHLDDMARHSPPESVHALDLDALRHPSVSFWCVWDGDTLAGCGALKRLDNTHGEIKSMRTASTHLRRGVAAQLLECILQQARQDGLQRLSLETGSMQVFEPARRLYERFGFSPCPPFNNYKLDPYSVFMTRELQATD
ncbi:MAG: GNAT family N-acetyltransferase [Granulosicoccaceae bacterium]